MAAFQLSKWYLDCVTDSGDVSIAYAGEVRWGRVHFNFSSLLESATGQPNVKHSLHERSAPEINQGCIAWQSKALHICGQWQADSAELRETILASDRGSIDWHCMMPRARATLGPRSGWGYAEHLNMSLAPWELPIATLRWGRFSNANHWIVWIDWEGSHSRRLVYWNGKPAKPERLEDDRLVLGDRTVLRMDRSLVIRDSPLGGTLLGAVPKLGKAFPTRMLGVHESKWRSRARLELPDGSTADGWAIHERVTWPQ